MKKILIFASLALALAAGLFAAAGDGPSFHRRHMGSPEAMAHHEEFMAKALDLNDEQKAAARKLHEEAMAKAKPLMEQQHRTVIAAVRGGGFDGPNGSVRAPEDMALGGAGAQPSAASGELRETPAPRPTPWRSAESARPSGDRTLDQVILEYLASEGSPEQIDLTFSPAPEFAAGRRVDVRIRAELALSRRPVAGATVQIRLVSSEKPIPVFQGRTGPDGGCVVAFVMPPVPAGVAAAVVRLTSAVGSTEIQYPVKSG